MGDPIVRDLISFTRTHLKLIVAIAFGAALVAFVFEIVKPQLVIASAILQTGTTREGPLESIEAVSNRITSAIEEQTKSGALPFGPELSVNPVLGPLPNVEATSLLEVKVVGPDPKTLELYLEAATKVLIESQQPLAIQEHARATAYIENIDSDLSAAYRKKFTKDGHDLIIKLVKERSDALRATSPARFFAPKSLGMHKAIERKKPKEIASMVLVGLIIGIGLGYAAGFFVEALRSPAGAPQSVTGGGGR